MNQESKESSGANQGNNCRGGFGRKARLGIGAAVLVGAGVLAGALGTVAVTASAYGGWGGGHHGRHGGAENAVERAEHVAARLSRKVDATAEQKDELTEIMRAMAVDIEPIANKHRADRKAMVAALLGTEVDREALQQLRDEQLELARDASNRLVSGLADAAEVLTAEQRTELRERLEWFHR